MTLSELIHGLCEYLRIEPLEPDAGGVYEIVFDDGLDVEILPLTGSQLLIRGLIADVPEDKDQQEEFFRTHLQNNLLNLQGQTCSLSLDRERGAIWLYRMARTDRIDVRQFCELVNELVNTLEWWHNLEGTNTAISPAAMMPFNMIRP